MSNRRLTWRRQSPLDMYKLVFGLLLLLSPWLFAFTSQAARMDAWVVGLALMAASAAALIAFADLEEWLALVLGLWLVAAPWLLGLPHTATKVHVSVGLLVSYLAGLELWLIHYDTAGR
jgi:predicted cobalt transporter CbtA